MLGGERQPDGLRRAAVWRRVDGDRQRRLADVAADREVGDDGERGAAVRQLRRCQAQLQARRGHGTRRQRDAVGAGPHDRGAHGRLQLQRERRAGVVLRPAAVGAAGAGDDAGGDVDRPGPNVVQRRGRLAGACCKGTCRGSRGGAYADYTASV